MAKQFEYVIYTSIVNDNDDIDATFILEAHSETDAQAKVRKLLVGKLWKIKGITPILESD